MPESGLMAQLKGFGKNGQFRSPPTRSCLPLNVPCTNWRMEGGIQARGNRYRANHEALMEGMKGRVSFLPLPLKRRVI